jgi:hypothetical protein
MQYPWFFLRCLVLLALVGIVGNSHAALPKLQTDKPAREVLLASGDQFQIFEDQAQARRLHLVPKNLRIARDGNGRPKVSVILVRDPAATPSNQAYGYIWLSVTIGTPITPALDQAIRSSITSKYPEYGNAVLSPIAFKPGTAQIGFQVKDSSAPITYVPITAPITVGSEFPVMIPISKEHGEIVRQAMDPSSTGLGISIYYKADATFAMAPSEIAVTANKKAVFDYFREKSSQSAGFWVFSWKSERDRIREKLEKTGDISSTTRVGDSNLLSAFGGVEYLKNLEKEMKARAVDFVADIDVDQTKSVPDGSYRAQPGRITLYSPSYYWSFSTHFGAGTGTVDIQRRAQGTYSERYKIEGQADLPITLVNEGFNLPKDFISVVSLDSAFYVRELIAAQGLPRGDVWGTGNAALQRGSLEVSVGAPGDPASQRFVFSFDAASPQDKTSPYWRNATFLRGQNGLINPVLPDLYVRGSITTSGAQFNAPAGGGYVKRARTSDALTAQSVSLLDLFDTISFSAELLFEEWQGTGLLQMQLKRNSETDNFEQFTLRRTSPVAIAPFLKGAIEKRQFRVRKVTGSSVGSWGNWRNITGPEVFLTVSDIPQ